MGAYKWYVIFNASLTVAFDVLHCTARPEPLYPYFIIVSGGLFKHVRFADVIPVIYVDAMFFLVVSAVLSTILLFLFRYAQTVESKLAHVLSTAKFAVPLILTAEFVLVGTMVVPFHMVSVQRSQLMSHRDFGVREAIQGRNAVGYLPIGVLWKLTSISTVVYNVVAVCVVAYCSTSCYRFLRRNKRRFTKHTVDLYETLVNVLMLDILICSITILCPVIVCNVVVLVRWSQASVVFVCALTVASLYPLATHVLLLTYVKPYRNAVVQAFLSCREQTK